MNLSARLDPFGDARSGRVVSVSSQAHQNPHPERSVQRQTTRTSPLRQIRKCTAALSALTVLFFSRIVSVSKKNKLSLRNGQTGLRLPCHRQLGLTRTKWRPPINTRGTGEFGIYALGACARGAGTQTLLSTARRRGQVHAMQGTLHAFKTPDSANRRLTHCFCLASLTFGMDRYLASVLP